ncbi:phosphoribosyltransferase [Asanoa sp. NPDC049518]|uniref:phosphoribosyltransferase n=1 Tax=unclassified Asanoa TaxID=2685164 RepID=UPI0034416B26
MEIAICWEDGGRRHRDAHEVVDAWKGFLPEAPHGKEDPVTFGPQVFEDRGDAGGQLASMLSHLLGRDVVVLGLPRGGVPVASRVAELLRAPLDVIVVRKLGVPAQPELAMGALGEGGVRVLHEDVIRHARVDAEELAIVEAAERAALTKRANKLRGEWAPIDLTGRTAIIVDDGIATGSTARAACEVARARGASRVVLAVPVAPADVVATLRRDADDVVCVHAPDFISSVGQWYKDFSPTVDDEVRELLARAPYRTPSAPSGRSDVADRDEEVAIELRSLHLTGHLTVPTGARGLVVFVHGSGSSRHSPRNRYVASTLNHAGLGTLLFDLLTPEEARARVNVFDIALLAGRLSDVTAWVRDQPWGHKLGTGFFGASTGAGAALWAAAEPHADVAAIVSRGGRPDLAGPRLRAVSAPTLLIVGGLDTAVLALNQAAQAELRCANDIVVVPGATHLFEEPGTLTTAACHARDWFTRYLDHQPTSTV